MLTYFCVMNTETEISPEERAKQIWHTFWKKPEANFFTAKEDSVFLVNTFVNESKYGNHLSAVTYWEEVLKCVNNL